LSLVLVSNASLTSWFAECSASSERIVAEAPLSVFVGYGKSRPLFVHFPPNIEFQQSSLAAGAFDLDRHELALQDVLKGACAIDALQHTVDRFPLFRPHSLLRNGHLQTLAGITLSGSPFPYRADRHRIVLPDGDLTVLHDDRPPDWQPTSPTTILVHGLTGCHASPYMVQAARKLNAAGVRTFRMDMRSCGAAEGLSRMPYHAGCSEDLLAALKRVAQLCPASPISVVGYSIGGNVALKMAGESASQLPQQLERMVVISPPIDLQFCVERFSQGRFRLYDRYLAMTHHRHLRRSKMLSSHAPHIVAELRPRGQKGFDDGYTSTIWGFESVEQFYSETSSAPVISRIRVPTLLIASRDDPLVPVELFEPISSVPAISVLLTNHGGHLGFIGRKGADTDRRWMDWRIVDFVTAASRRAMAA